MGIEKNKVDVSKIDLDKEREKITDLPGLIEFAHTVGGALIRPEDKGKIKGQSVAAMRDQTDRQFNQLFKQMQQLMDQANQLKSRVEVSERIYQCTLNFKPVINHIYHLYERENSTDFLSMVAPGEWGSSIPFKRFVASVKLLSDYTWEVIEESKTDDF